MAYHQYRYPLDSSNANTQSKGAIGINQQDIAMSDTEEQQSKSISYEDRVKHISVISVPLAGKKLTKKLYKLVKKAVKAKSTKRGVKEVVKALRKGEKGLCVIAGDISPVDVITHLPVLCEENEVPYIYVPSKVDLGASASSKRPTSCIMITKKPDFSAKDLYDEMIDAVTKNQPTF